MYETYKYHALDGGVLVDFMGAVDGDGFFNIQQVEYDFDTRNVDRPKLEAHGSWPTFAYYERMRISLEGTIVADSPTNFMTFKHLSTQLLMPLIEVDYTERLQGQIRMKPVGFDETMSIPVVVESPLKVISGPGMAPSAGTFRIVFKAFRPYFVGLTSDTFFWVS